MILHDITFTVRLDEDMTQDRYDAIMRFVNEEGTGDVNTHTYDPEKTNEDGPLFTSIKLK